MGKYDNIINLPHHRSKYHKPMPAENRAAQFAPFAALSGHEDMIEETARLTDKKVEPTDEEKMAIGKVVTRSIQTGETIRITYFVSDRTKAGGSYKSITAVANKIDESDRTLLLDTGLKLNLDNIVGATIVVGTTHSSLRIMPLSFRRNLPDSMTDKPD